MQKNLRILFLTIAFAILSVALSAQTGKSSQIKNGVKLKTDGLTVSKAYLADEDRNELKENQTALNKPIFLHLEIAGWNTNNEKVVLGASEKITTDNGSLVLYEDDLFPGKEEYKAEDAKYISLKAIITSITGDIKSFNINFRVWDKSNGNNITGSYTFKIKK